MTLAAVLALVIFVLMFAVITWGKVHRFIPALIGGALVFIVVFLVVMRDAQLAVNVLNLRQLVEGRFWVPGHEPLESRGINWQTIIFIAGMMIMVEGLAKVGFFRWMCLLVAKKVHYKTIPILIAFTLLSGFLSMFIDSITVMLFLATVTVELARLLKFDPVPVIISEIFAANTGGSATMSGDPPNIIIGTALGLSFMDFVVNTGLIAWAGMVVTVIFFYFASRKALVSPKKSATEDTKEKYPEPGEAIKNRGMFAVQTAIFLLIIALLVTHASTGISPALIGVIAAVLTLLSSTGDAWQVFKKTDWRTLLFFIGLFICVGGLEETGTLKALARTIGNVSGGSLMLLITILIWVNAIVSGFVDNIPLAATMVPVISSLAQASSISVAPLAWTTALGTDIGGNATPIGASANVVGTAISEREGYPIRWGRYLKYGVPSTILVVALCWILLMVRY